MSRTYTIIPASREGWFKICSNGKELSWIYPSRECAAVAVRDLADRARRRAQYREWRREAGIVRVRDSKRSKAYKAERLAGIIGGAPLEMPLPTMARMCVRWAHEIGRTEVVVPPRVRVSRRRGSGGCAFRNEIVLGSRACLGVLVHEYAHILTWDEQPAHGPRWAQVYVDLVRVAMGPGFAERLAEGFRRIGFRIELQKVAA